MLNKLFFKYVKQGVLEGQAYYATGLKLMVQSANEKIFDLLDCDNNEIFLNPMLFAYLNEDENKINLEQILYGSISVEKKPACISVLSNSNGEIYLPDLGCIKLNIFKQQRFKLVTDRNDNRIRIFDGSVLINHSFKVSPTIEFTNIEIQCVDNYLTGKYVTENSLSSLNRSFCKTKKNIQEINQAVIILKEHFPNFFDLLCIVTKWIFPFRSSKSNSFATLGMHGVGFINTYKTGGVIFFLEDIVHQCGHIIFSSLTCKPSEYFNIDPNTMTSKFTNDKSDDRTLYVLFHGIFTESLICEMFDICIVNKVFNSQEEHELKGRFCYILLRFLFDTEILKNNNYFSKKGLVIFDQIYKNMVDMYRRYGFLLQVYDLSNQPYNFDYPRFILKNNLSSIA